MSTILRSQIHIPERARKDYGDLSGTIDSIESLGLIHPLILAQRAEPGPNGELFDLIAGGRRLACCDELEVTEFHHGTTCDPTKLGYLFQVDLRPDQLLEIELEENLQRKKMTWTEEIILISRVHKEKSKVAALALKPWGLRQTGQLLGVSYGEVQLAIKVAESLLAKDVDIMACECISDAIKVYDKRQVDAAAALLAQRAGMGKSSSADAIAREILSMSGSKNDQDPVFNLGKPEGVESAPQELKINLNRRLFLGDSVREILPKFPSGLIDHIFTDIPYGIDMENLEGMEDIERVEGEHEVEENIEIMEPFLQEAFRITKPHAFCVFFYDLDHHQYLKETAKRVGWLHQRWPITWRKKHRCRNMAAQYNFTKTEEWAMVLRKPGVTLTIPQGTSCIEADGSLERKHYANPFAKPFVVWKFLFDAIAIRGQTILDPFAGEMSCPRAAVLCGLEPFAIEKKPEHFNRGVEQVKTAYKLLTEGKVVFE